MADHRIRLNLTLDPEHAKRLARLAARSDPQEGTLDRSLLSTAIDEANPSACTVVRALDSIPGAWDRAQVGLDQGRRGETRVLDDL